MITPSFGLTATERVLPKLALDFTTASLDSRVTFTRTTDATHPATYTDSSGYISSATNDQPRFDYDTTTLVCKGLLIEESRTNIATYSDNFSSSVYTATGAAVTVDATASPSNATDADFLKEDSANSTHFLSKIAPSTVTSGTSYTFSVFAKANGRSWLRLNLSAGANLRAYFDLANGVVGSKDAGVTSTITPAGNGFYRCTLTATTASTSAVLQFHLASADGTVVYQGDGTSGIYLWGAQLELGAFATSYIPTTSAALTRNADVATMTGTNFSDWFNASEGTFVISANPTLASAVTIASINDGSIVTNAIEIGKSSTTTKRLRVFTAGATEASLSYTGLTAGEIGTVCAAYKANSIAFSQDAATPLTDSAAAIPTVNQLCIGNRVGLDTAVNTTITNLNYYTQRLTNAEVQAFSK